MTEQLTQPVPSATAMARADNRIAPADLEAFVAAVFRNLGVPEERAARAAQTLILSDVRGVTSHGVARMEMYVSQITSGAIDPTVGMTLVRESGATAVFDANHGLALALAPEAMDVCIAKALDIGVGMVTVHHSTHFGIAGGYAMQAAAQGLGGLAMTNSGPLAPPTGGRIPMLGTNPIGFAVPGGAGQPPFVLDMATTAIAYGKLENARRANKPLAPGLVVDKDGAPTTDPYVAQFLMPLGGEQATSGYKGYGLAVMVDVLCGPLASAMWGTHLASVMRTGVKANLGHAFMAWRIDAFRDPEEFARDVQMMLAELRATPPAPGYEATGVLAPGDPELAATIVNQRDGIALHPTVWAELEAIAQRTGTPLP